MALTGGKDEQLAAGGIVAGFGGPAAASALSSSALGSGALGAVGLGGKIVGAITVASGPIGWAVGGLIAIGCGVYLHNKSKK